MGLWMKKGGEFIPVSGGSGSGGPHDHDDYLPLAGGTLTGGLTVDKNLTLTSEASNPLMVVNRAGTRVGYFGVPGAQAGENGELWLRGDKELILQGADGGVRTRQCGLTVDGNLQVNGTINGQLHCQAGSFSRPAITFDNTTSGFYGGGSYVATNVNGVTQFAAYNDRVEVFTNLKVNGTINGQTVFAIADGIDTAEVLDRAETATMPALDDEGVATTDAEVESITVNEVVTALLAKVKELSARIKTLEQQ